MTQWASEGRGWLSSSVTMRMCLSVRYVWRPQAVLCVLSLCHLSHWLHSFRLTNKHYFWPEEWIEAGSLGLALPRLLSNDSSRKQFEREVKPDFKIWNISTIADASCWPLHLQAGWNQLRNCSSGSPDGATESLWNRGQKNGVFQELYYAVAEYKLLEKLVCPCYLNVKYGQNLKVSRGGSVSPAACCTIYFKLVILSSC